MCTEKIIFMAGNTHEYVAKEGSCDLFCGRAPHGARGLKQNGAEIIYYICGRAPHGARGLKRMQNDTDKRAAGRAPHGARGLKPALVCADRARHASRPARGAWIETTMQ